MKTKIFDKANVIKYVIKVCTDIILALIAAVFCYFLIGTIIPQVLEGLLTNGFMTLNINFAKLKEVFSIWHCFVILYGVRFVIAFVTGFYSLKNLKGENNDERIVRLSVGRED